MMMSQRSSLWIAGLLLGGSLVAFNYFAVKHKKARNQYQSKVVIESLPSLLFEKSTINLLGCNIILTRKLNPYRCSDRKIIKVIPLKYLNEKKSIISNDKRSDFLLLRHNLIIDNGEKIITAKYQGGKIIGEKLQSLRAREIHIGCSSEYASPPTQYYIHIRTKKGASGLFIKKLKEIKKHCSDCIDCSLNINDHL